MPRCARTLSLLPPHSPPKVLATSAKDFKDFADVLDVVTGDAARVVAVTSPDKAAGVNAERPGFWEVRKVL